MSCRSFPRRARKASPIAPVISRQPSPSRTLRPTALLQLQLVDRDDERERCVAGEGHAGPKVAGREYLCEMKVGIVVPYSWSFWGAVVEHAELQAAALRTVGHDVRLVMGNDPPGSFTRVLHPRLGRHGEPPPEVIPIGRSVIVPANGSLPNIILSPRSLFRIRRVLETEQFDLLHLHEPMTPAPCVATLALARCPLVATFHASGELSWLKPAKLCWGFLLDRLDHRIAVSEPARESAARYFPAEYELIPNGVLIPERAEPGGREDRIVFVGRHEPRKGLQILLRAW
ncbi:MAG: glycosyltransferase family 4 protein, partial [Actinobacteria bacterium]